MADPKYRFDDRMQILHEMVGGGKITGRVVFDQVYAARQHEDLSFRHPRGGQAQYLSTALMQDFAEAYQNIARNLYRQPLVTHMVVETQSLAEHASRLAPIEFNDLRRSHSISILDAGKIAFTRPAAQKRLSVRERRNKDRMRRSGGR